MRPWEEDRGGIIIPQTELKQQFDKILCESYTKVQQALRGSGGGVVTSDDYSALYTAVYRVCSTREHAQEPGGLYAYNAFCKLVEDACKETYTPAQRQQWGRFFMKKKVACVTVACRA